MRWTYHFATASLFTTALASKEFPVIDGIIGGVPRNRSRPLAPVRVFSSPLNSTVTPGKLRYVENSGICETTKGVYQASGYADLAANQSMWFWFFEARSNPERAPLALWLNGGPGSSSLVGLFSENGPCRMNEDGVTHERNPYSWNEYANVIYVDQPIGVGYSYGETVVGSSQEAAAAVWNMLQIFFKDTKFSKYASRDFAIWTESYGGHYGPAFAAHFLSQNDAINAGKIKGVKVNLKALSIGNGLTDPISQYPDLLEYALHNPYNSPLVNDSVISAVNNSLYRPGGCMAQIEECNRTNRNEDCSAAQDFCDVEVMTPLSGDYDPYDVRYNSSNPYPYSPRNLLRNSTVMSTIGALQTWVPVSLDVYFNFAATGDWMKTSRPDLERVINAGIRTLIVAGDADYIVNYKGVESMVDALQTKYTRLYHQQKWANWTVDGTVTGIYKNAGPLSYLRVFKAGHLVPAYGNGELEVGQAALVYFTQTMRGKPISSA